MPKQLAIWSCICIGPPISGSNLALWIRPQHLSLPEPEQPTQHHEISVPIWRRCASSWRYSCIVTRLMKPLWWCWRREFPINARQFSPRSGFGLVPFQPDQLVTTLDNCAWSLWVRSSAVVMWYTRSCARSAQWESILPCISRCAECGIFAWLHSWVFPVFLAYFASMLHVLLHISDTVIATITVASTVFSSQVFMIVVSLVDAAGRLQMFNQPRGRQCDVHLDQLCVEHCWCQNPELLVWMHQHEPRQCATYKSVAGCLSTLELANQQFCVWMIDRGIHLCTVGITIGK